MAWFFGRNFRRNLFLRIAEKKTQKFSATSGAVLEVGGSVF